MTLFILLRCPESILLAALIRAHFGGNVAIELDDPPSRYGTHLTGKLLYPLTDKLRRGDRVVYVNPANFFGWDPGQGVYGIANVSQFWGDEIISVRRRKVNVTVVFWDGTPIPAATRGYKVLSMRGFVASLQTNRPRHLEEVERLVTTCLPGTLLQSGAYTPALLKLLEFAAFRGTFAATQVAQTLSRKPITSPNDWLKVFFLNRAERVGLWVNEASFELNALILDGGAPNLDDMIAVFGESSCFCFYRDSFRFYAPKDPPVQGRKKILYWRERQGLFSLATGVERFREGETVMTFRKRRFESRTGGPWCWRFRGHVRSSATPANCSLSRMLSVTEHGYIAAAPRLRGL